VLVALSVSQEIAEHLQEEQRKRRRRDTCKEE
jgi:hypothetical protein